VGSVLEQVRTQRLDRYALAELGVNRFVHESHAATAELTYDPIRSDRSGEADASEFGGRHRTENRCKEGRSTSRPRREKVTHPRPGRMEPGPVRRRMRVKAKDGRRRPSTQRREGVWSPTASPLHWPRCPTRSSTRPYTISVEAQRSPTLPRHRTCFWRS